MRLRVGQHLGFCDPDGLQVVGEVGFDSSRLSSRRSGWFDKFQKHSIREGAPLEHDFTTHRCFECRLNLKPHLDKVGRQLNENCPQCGTPVMFPLLPPDSYGRKGGRRSVYG